MDDLLIEIALALNCSSDEIKVLSKCGDGYTNDNFVFEYCDKKFVYRKSSGSANSLSVNRTAEHQAAIEIKKVVKTPDIIYFDFSSGNMITEFIDGRSLDYNELVNDKMLPKIIDCMKSIHMQKTRYHFNPYNDILKRIEYAKEKNTLDFDFIPLIEHMNQIEKKKLPDNDKYFGLCHNDFFTTNFLIKDDDIFVFDFEFSAMGDIFFDLGCLGIAMPDGYHKKILEIYFGRSDESLIEKLNDGIFIARLWNTTWALVKYADGCSKIDYKKAVEYHYNLLQDECNKKVSS
ncbi:MAG: phosphotransferase [Saccharofermentanales bacterium]